MKLKTLFSINEFRPQLSIFFSQTYEIKIGWFFFFRIFWRKKLFLRFIPAMDCSFHLFFSWKFTFFFPQPSGGTWTCSPSCVPPRRPGTSPGRYTWRTSTPMISTARLVGSWIIIKFIQDVYSIIVLQYNTRTKFLNLTCH